jgi:Protein of unknown function (DUF1559)
MDASHSFGEDVNFIPDESPPRTSNRFRHRITPWDYALFICVAAAILGLTSLLIMVPGLHRDQCEANLTRLGLAFHEYEQAHGHFPAPALARSDGTPLLSWRVALLRRRHPALYQ